MNRTRKALICTWRFIALPVFYLPLLAACAAVECYGYASAPHASGPVLAWPLDLLVFAGAAVVAFSRYLAGRARSRGGRYEHP